MTEWLSLSQIYSVYVCAQSLQSCPTLSVPLHPPPGNLLTQGLNPCLLHLLHGRWIFAHWATWEAHIKYTWHTYQYFSFHPCSRLHESFTEQCSQKLSQHGVTDYTVGLNGKAFSSSVTAEIFMNILLCSYIVFEVHWISQFLLHEYRHQERISSLTMFYFIFLLSVLYLAS